jgi:hypothetical protein
MELKTVIGQMLDKTLELAKKQRAAIPYSQTDGFPQSVIVLGPNLEVATLPVLWSTEAEKYARFRAVSKAAKDTLASAVILISDTRWLEEETICEKLGIPPTKEIWLKPFQTLYRNAVTERFGGYLGNMPPDWYTDALITVAKGPTIPVMLRTALYKRGVNDSIE